MKRTPNVLFIEMHSKPTWNLVLSQPAEGPFMLLFKMNQTWDVADSDNDGIEFDDDVKGTWPGN